MAKRDPWVALTVRLSAKGVPKGAGTLAWESYAINKEGTLGLGRLVCAIGRRAFLFADSALPDGGGDPIEQLEIVKAWCDEVIGRLRKEEASG